MTATEDYFITFPSDHAYRRHFVLVRASSAEEAIRVHAQAHGPTPVIVFLQESFYSNAERLKLRHLSTIAPTADGSFEAEIKETIFTASPSARASSGEVTK